MASPESVLRSRIESSNRSAENCKSLAAKAGNDVDRERWLRLADFWADRARSAEVSMAGLTSRERTVQIPI
jgi:hypothetical protein